MFPKVYGRKSIMGWAKSQIKRRLIQTGDFKYDQGIGRFKLKSSTERISNWRPKIDNNRVECKS